MVASRNIGGEVTYKSALRPRDQADAAAFGLAGLAIDRQGFMSGLFIVDAGPSTGGPASVTIDAKLQHSDVSGSGYTDVAVSPENPAVAIAQIVAANSGKPLEIDFTALKRYVRLVFTVAHTGGASPKTGLSAGVTLSPLVKPPAHSV
jgi:hypothetical protein